MTHKLRYAFVFAAALVLAAGCTHNDAGRTPAASPENSSGGNVARPGTISAADAKAFIAAHPEALVLDVRNPGEWDDDLGHIDGARLIPLPELDARIGEIAAWKDKPVVAVCRVGARSARAAELLAQAGFQNVKNLEGGMEAWRKAGY